jgi:hypothetical protein
LESALCPAEVLPPSGLRDEVLVEAQASLRSAIGAVIYHTGGILIDDGWLRVLGSGHPRLARTLPGWNREVHGEGAVKPPFTLIADDAAGGFFAINHGGLGAEVGSVFFFAPDRMVWEDMGGSYAEWLRWALYQDVAGYYKTLRWPNWEHETRDLPGDQALALYPFPFSTDGRDPSKSAQRAVPVLELYQLYVRDIAPQVAGLGKGDHFAIDVGLPGAPEGERD